LQLNPWLRKIRKIIESSPGVLGGTLSGSGSAMFAIMQDGDCARTLVQSLKEQNLYRVYHVKDWKSGKISDQVMRLEANRAGLENAGLDDNA
jgi:homoserine kinase